MKVLRLSVAILTLLRCGILADVHERTHRLTFPAVFENRSIKRDSETSPSVRIAIRAS